jgi:hypothetical protein
MEGVCTLYAETEVAKKIVTRCLSELLSLSGDQLAELLNESSMRLRAPVTKEKKWANNCGLAGANVIVEGEKVDAAAKMFFACLAGYRIALNLMNQSTIITFLPTLTRDVLGSDKSSWFRDLIARFG